MMTDKRIVKKIKSADNFRNHFNRSAGFGNLYESARYGVFEDGTLIGMVLNIRNDWQVVNLSGIRMIKKYFRTLADAKKAIEENNRGINYDNIKEIRKTSN